MFETHESSRLGVPPECDTPFVTVWASVFTRTQTPWLHVAYKTLGMSEDSVTVIIFLRHPEQLAEMKEYKRVEIIEVNLVSPAYLNGFDRWGMEELDEILEADEPATGHRQVAHIFVLTGGKRYVDSALDTNENKLLNPRSLFKAKN